MKRSVVVAALVALIAAPALADPAGDVRACMLRFASLRSFEMDMQSQGRPVTIQIVNPDSFRMSGGGLEMVRLRTTMYMKMPGQGWMKTPSTHGAAPGTDMAAKIRALANDSKAITAKDLGMKAAGGETLHAYDVTQKDGERMILYVGGDGYPHQITPQGGSDSRQPIRFSKFNGVPAIKAPI